MRKALRQINERLQALGIKITAVVGNMWTALAFSAIALVALPSALASGSIVVLVAWLSSQFLQLTLLAVILVGQNAQEARHEIRDIETHEVVMQSHLELRLAHEQHADKLNQIIELLGEEA